MAGFIKQFFKKSQNDSRKYVTRRDMRDNGAGFDGAGYSKHKGMWKDKPMGEFKKLFDE
jgi:hypothetical protein